ncbi:DUF523 domain-containing protein [Bacillus sp. NPDC093026]|uniref:DUF523 domain-containing protein n=1 Tax=Bacillus sp. NPDC093026 TaxID=3363948 RepID=UPI0038102108
MSQIVCKKAQDTLKQVQALAATAVVLKEHSPSCGSRMIYQGDFGSEVKFGDGVTSTLLNSMASSCSLKADDWVGLFCKRM